jgi:hypothetical protein
MAKKKLTDRITARVDFPRSFLESVFGSFSIFRAEGEDRCVRYAIGDEALQCYLPVFDHRPPVLAAAKTFDAKPDPEAALGLVSNLLAPADVQVGRRTGKAGGQPFLTLQPATQPKPRHQLTGSELDFDPETLSEGIACDGREAVWYWIGVLPMAGRAKTGLKLVHLCLFEPPGYAPRK